jgi:hypothetical protein
VIGLAAGGARGQVRCEPGGEQELEAEGELVCVRRELRPRVEQRQLVA